MKAIKIKNKKQPANHTLMVSYPTHNIWITLLTSIDPNLKEYRFTYSDGVVRYLTMDEIKNSPFSFMVGEIDNLLTDDIDENKVGLYNGELYIKN